MTPALAVFLKAPRIGTVKTRIAAEIGERQALRLYRVLAHRTLAEVRLAGLEATVWFTPSDAAMEMRRWLGDGWDLRPQASGDLGTRLAAAARRVPRSPDACGRRSQLSPSQRLISVAASLGVNHTVASRPARRTSASVRCARTR